jgi:hypothetical protein
MCKIPRGWNLNDGRCYYALYPIPVHTPRMCPVVAHAPCMLLYRTVRSDPSGPSGPSGPLLIAIRHPTITYHTYTITHILLCCYVHSPTPTHPPPVSIPACIGVRALRRAHLIRLSYIYRIHSGWMYLYLPVHAYDMMIGHHY